MRLKAGTARHGTSRSPAQPGYSWHFPHASCCNCQDQPSQIICRGNVSGAPAPRPAAGHRLLGRPGSAADTPLGTRSIRDATCLCYQHPRHPQHTDLWREIFTVRVEPVPSLGLNPRPIVLPRHSQLPLLLPHGYFRVLTNLFGKYMSVFLLAQFPA